MSESTKDIFHRCLMLHRSNGIQNSIPRLDDTGACLRAVHVMNTSEKSQKQRDILLLVSKISNLLDTGLDNRSLYICIRLIEAGVHPECLADIIKDLRNESSSMGSKTAASRPLSVRSKWWVKWFDNHVACPLVRYIILIHIRSWKIWELFDKIAFALFISGQQLHSRTFLFYLVIDIKKLWWISRGIELFDLINTIYKIIF